jgi:hypothetical protein
MQENSIGGADLNISSLVPIQLTSAFREHDEGVVATECEGAAGGQAKARPRQAMKRPQTTNSDQLYDQQRGYQN